ncbi:FluC/FEX family fluoride channel [Corynebacterium lowii]|uniref:Fluoride-specific ion channel n=1 Tax=Corynebacterium lowii TaxID=1544413 RepID=A0A0Q1DXC1_9CORY|nr:CrcB family protein [Corynebacterium lowii]KQB84870.1 putative fluoride ion transporter CrcB [Corynebacterium lowii]MDP9851774.1 CrcB protein [Corynebacterium lowii]
MLIAAVASGAFLGGVGRYLLSRRPGGWQGTGIANVLACAVLGLSLYLGDLGAAAWGAGVAGALSTWSTVASEVGAAMKARRTPRAAAYLGLTLCMGCAVLWMISPR